MTAWAIVWRAAVLVVALAALVPVRTRGLDSHARPALSYGDALARVDRQRAADQLTVVPEGATSLLTHGQRTPRAVVLLHGFSNSPRQFAAFAARLEAEGDNVYIPRLPHHALRADSPEAIGQLTAEELRDAGDAAVDIARGLGDSVIVVGLSAGGLVATWIAEYRSDVQRVVTIAPLVELARIPRSLEEPLMNVALRAPDVTHRAATDTTRSDRVLGWSTHAVAQMIRLGVATREAAGRSPPVVANVVILLNEHDRTVKGDAALDLARRWAAHGAAPAMYVLPDSLLLPHDVVDPREVGGNPALIYPVLDDLAHGRTPPPWVRSRSARGRGDTDRAVSPPADRR